MRAPASLPGAAVGALVAGWVVYASAADLNKPVPEKRASAITLRPAEAFGEDWAARKDMPVFSNTEDSELHAGLYQKRNKLRLAFQLAKALRGLQ